MLSGLKKIKNGSIDVLGRLVLVSSLQREKPNYSDSFKYECLFYALFLEPFSLLIVRKYQIISYQGKCVILINVNRFMVLFPSYKTGMQKQRNDAKPLV